MFQRRRILSKKQIRPRKTSSMQFMWGVHFARRFAIWGAVLAVIAICPALHAQFGPPPPQGHGPKVPAPTAFPPSGTFPTTESVTLLDAEPGAAIHYTLDGSVPTAESPVFNPSKLIFLAGFYDGMLGVRAGYTIRAVAIKEGHTNSEVSHFEYVIDRQDITSYTSAEILPGVRMIRDSFNDKMFLIRGTRTYVLIDSGMGRGALMKYVSRFTGGKPMIAIFTHNHGDHIGQADQFIRESKEYIGGPDRTGLVRLLESRDVPADVIAKNVISVHDGEKIEIGGRSLTVYSVPGHTPGSIVIFDEQTGNLFTGDAFGSNSPTIPDAAWMQFDPKSLDIYLAEVRRVRACLGNGVRYIMTGHNDHPLKGEIYLVNLEKALQLLMDKGNAALVPSYRPAGLWQVVVGDRFTDPNWVAINVNRTRFLPSPVETIDSLSRIAVEGLKLSPDFTPEIKNYTVNAPQEVASVTVTAVPTSSRATIDIFGKPVSAGKSYTTKLRASKVQIEVKSPDGTSSATYTLTVSNQ
jgi:glyoxylase-like metal-dependent hydrolase (beta-lactamase superfamily II)